MGEGVVLVQPIKDKKTKNNLNIIIVRGMGVTLMGGKGGG